MRKSKEAYAIAAAVLSFVVSEGATSAASVAKQGPWTIGVEEPVGGQPWRELAVATLQNLAAQPAYAPKIKKLTVVKTQNNDPAAQVAAMRNLIAAGVDEIIFDPASPTAENPVIQQAKARNISVISVAQDVDSDDAYVVATDYDKAGEIEAEWLIKHLKGDKKIVFFEGIKGTPINESAVPKVQKMFKDAGVQIVATSTSGWDDSTAQKNMAAILASHTDIDGVYVYLAGGVGVINAYQAAGRPFVPVATGAGYNNEPCTFLKYQPQGLQAVSAAGQQAIYAKGLEVGIEVLEGKQVPRKQFFAPTVLSTDDMAGLKKACHTNLPALFGINYEFPGLNLPLVDTLKYYEGAKSN
jgi:ribose transport system substrate-binding protein